MTGGITNVGLPWLDQFNSYQDVLDARGGTGRAATGFGRPQPGSAAQPHRSR